MAATRVREVGLLSDSMAAVLHLFLGPNCSHVDHQHGAARLQAATAGWQHIISHIWCVGFIAQHEHTTLFSNPLPTLTYDESV